VHVLSRRFRRLFLEQAKPSFHGQLSELNNKAQLKQHIAAARKQDWVVYAKAQFGGPEKAIDSLGRYTHKVEITNHRILRDNGGKVSFRYKDYSSAEPQKQRTMPLTADKFIRRFLLRAITGSLPIPTVKSEP